MDFFYFPSCFLPRKFPLGFFSQGICLFLFILAKLCFARMKKFYGFGEYLRSLILFTQARIFMFCTQKIYHKRILLFWDREVTLVLFHVSLPRKMQSIFPDKVFCFLFYISGDLWSPEKEDFLCLVYIRAQWYYSYRGHYEKTTAKELLVSC